MKLSKKQLEEFEKILSSQGYKKQSYSVDREDFSWYKVVFKTEDFSVNIGMKFFDFSKYRREEFNTLPIGFDTDICIVNKTLPTTLDIPFCEDEGKSIFNFYDPEPKDKQYYKPREFTPEEVQKFLGNLESIATHFKFFYEKILDKKLSKSFRK